MQELEQAIALLREINDKLEILMQAMQRQYLQQSESQSASGSFNREAGNA